MLIIDVSGSMNFASGIAGLTRLDLVKASVSELLEQYDNLGDVKVRIVTFSNGGSQQGGAWVDVEQAKTIVNGLTAGGSTNYDAALTTAQAAFASNGKYSDGQNVSYFLSDGDPSTSPTGPHQSAWLSFVNGNDIDSFAIGVGNGVSVTSLNPIAFDGRGAGTEANGIVVTDPDQLIGTLIGTLVQPVNSNVLLNGTPENKFGADGGYVRSIGFDERTYTYDKATNTIYDDNAGPLDNASFNFSSHVLTIVSAISGTLAIDMDSAAYTFTAPGSNSNVQSVVYGYTLIDGDGDTASNTLTITLHNTELPPIVRDDNVITNISGGFGTNIAIPDIALLYNDTDAAGQAIGVTGVSKAESILLVS
jgi:uncharacterized protein YegL